MMSGPSNHYGNFPNLLLSSLTICECVSVCTSQVSRSWEFPTCHVMSCDAVSPTTGTCCTRELTNTDNDFIISVKFHVTCVNSIPISCAYYTGAVSAYKRCASLSLAAAISAKVCGDLKLNKIKIKISCLIQSVHPRKWART